MSNPTRSAETREINIAGSTLMALVLIIGAMLMIGPPTGVESSPGGPKPHCEDFVPPAGMTSMGAAASFASRHPEIPRTQVDEKFIEFAKGHGLNPEQAIPPLEHGALTVCRTPDKTEVQWVYVKVAQ